MLALALLCLAADAKKAPPESARLLDSGPALITRWTFARQGLELASGVDKEKTRILYAQRGDFDLTLEDNPPQKLLEGELVYLTPSLRYALTSDPRAHLAGAPELVSIDIHVEEAARLDVRSIKVRTAEHVNHTIASGLGTAAVLLDASNLGHSRFAVSRLAMRAGAEVPKHVHADSDEILLALEGEAFMLVEGKATKIVAGETARILRGAEHSAKVPKRFVALQVYAPAGPEQRFKSAPAAK
jgi:quercetin dioxygenase-like cupin family protein